jgi:hypothetical protein
MYIFRESFEIFLFGFTNHILGTNILIRCMLSAIEFVRQRVPVYELNESETVMKYHRELCHEISYTDHILYI